MYAFSANGLITVVLKKKYVCREEHTLVFKKNTHLTVVHSLAASIRLFIIMKGYEDTAAVMRFEAIATVAFLCQDGISREVTFYLFFHA